MMQFFTLGPVLASLLTAQSYGAPGLARDPMVTRISEVHAQQYQTITIRGVNFGHNVPYDGDSSVFWMVDIQANGTGWWRAGCPAQYGPCGTTLKVTTWVNDRIVVSGFTGDSLYPGVGDLVCFFVWNPQSGRGPASASAMVN